MRPRPWQKLDNKGLPMIEMIRGTRHVIVKKP
jgi:hypothetical protein